MTTTLINGLTISVSLCSEPGVEAERITFKVEYEEPSYEVDERTIEVELWEFFSRGTGQGTLSLSRTFSRGGWGADGPWWLSFAIHVAEGVSTVGVVALAKRLLKREPTVTVEKPRELRAGPPPKPTNGSGGRGKKPGARNKTRG